MGIRIVRRRRIGAILPIGQPPPPPLFQHTKTSYLTKAIQFISSLYKSDSIDMGPDTWDLGSDTERQFNKEQHHILLANLDPEFPTFSKFRGILDKVNAGLLPLTIASSILFQATFSEIILYSCSKLEGPPRGPSPQFLPRTFYQQDPYLYFISAIYLGITFTLFQSGYHHLPFMSVHSSSGSEDRRNKILRAMSIDRHLYSWFLTTDNDPNRRLYMSCFRKSFLFEKFNLALHIANPEVHGPVDFYSRKNVTRYLCIFQASFTALLILAIHGFRHFLAIYFGQFCVGYNLMLLFFVVVALPCYQYFGWYMKLGELALEIRQDCLMGKHLSQYPSEKGEKDGLKKWAGSYSEARKRLENEIWEILKDDDDTEKKAAKRREEYFFPILDEIRL